MKNLILATILGSFFLTSLVMAADEEKTVEGTMCCAKCCLEEADACADVVKVGDTKYYLEEDGKVKTSAHKCSGTVDVKVSGKVEDRDGKTYLVVSSIEKK